MSKKEKVLTVLLIIEVIIGCIFLVLYINEAQNSQNSLVYCSVCVVMFFFTAITLITTDLKSRAQKVIKKAGRFAKFVFDMTIGLVFRIFDALLNMTHTNRNGKLKIITGYQDKEIAVAREKHRRRASYKRYKLMDNREKVRYLYYKIVTKAMRKGFGFKESDTPYEVNGKLVDRKYIKNRDMQLGGIYNISRYDSKSEITDKMVEILKETC